MAIDAKRKLLPAIPATITVLDIGSQWTRLGSVTKKGRLTRLTTEPTPPHCVTNGSIPDPENLSDLLKQLRRRHRLRDRRVVLLINDYEVSITPHTVPSAGVQALAAAPAWVLGETISAGLRQPAIDSRVINTIDGMAQLSVAVTPGEPINGLAAAVMAAGMIPVRATPLLSALAAATIHTPPTPDNATPNPTELVLHLSHSAAGFAFMESGLIRYSRFSAPQGTHSLADWDNPQACSEYISRLVMDATSTLRHVGASLGLTTAGLVLTGAAKSVIGLTTRLPLELGLNYTGVIAVKAPRKAPKNVDLTGIALCAAALRNQHAQPKANTANEKGQRHAA